MEISKKAVSTVKKILDRGTVPGVMAELNEGAEIYQDDSTALPERHESDERRNLKQLEVEVFGSWLITLLALGAIPDVMSSELCARLHLQPEAYNDG